MTNQTKSQIKTKNLGQICLALIDRPRDRNSINTPLMQEIDALVTRLENQHYRAVIFTGVEDKYFMGGADGLEMMDCDRQGAIKFSQRIQALFNRLESSPLVLVSAINGLCFGGGFEFAMACDFRIMALSAKIGLPEVKVGIIPGGGGTQRLPALVGTGKAMEMILTGKLYTAPEALSMGLVHQSSPQEELIGAAQALLAQVMKNPHHALAQAKKAVKGFQQQDLHKGFALESQAFGQCFENSFFMDLMNEQLEKGILETTTPRPVNNPLTNPK